MKVRYIGEQTTFHPKFGKLEPGQVFDAESLPGDAAAFEAAEDEKPKKTKTTKEYPAEQEGGEE